MLCGLDEKIKSYCWERNHSSLFCLKFLSQRKIFFLEGFQNNIQKNFFIERKFKEQAKRSFFEKFEFWKVFMRELKFRNTLGFKQLGSKEWPFRLFQKRNKYFCPKDEMPWF